MPAATENRGQIAAFGAVYGLLAVRAAAGVENHLPADRRNTP